MVHGPLPAAPAGIIDPLDGRHPAAVLEPDAPGTCAGGWSKAPLILRGAGLERELRCRVLQSPLAGVSDRIFRGLVRRWAPEALLFTEMVNATSLELGHGRGKVEDLADEAGPIGVQLFDHRPEAMAEAARRAEASGAFLIDINMGCPVRKIARKGGGSGLIRDPELAARIVEAVAAAVSVPVTVKTRLAWCGDPGSERAGVQDSQADGLWGDAAGGTRADASGDAAGEALEATRGIHDEATLQRALSWCRRLEEAGARMLTLHGRTREQGFRGRADWQAIGAVKRALGIPVIANGDVRGPEEARRCLAISRPFGP